LIESKSEVSSIRGGAPQSAASYYTKNKNSPHKEEVLGHALSQSHSKSVIASSAVVSSSTKNLHQKKHNPNDESPGGIWARPGYLVDQRDGPTAKITQMEPPPLEEAAPIIIPKNRALSSSEAYLEEVCEAPAAKYQKPQNKKQQDRHKEAGSPLRDRPYRDQGRPSDARSVEKNTPSHGSAIEVRSQSASHMKRSHQSRADQEKESMHSASQITNTRDKLQNQRIKVKESKANLPVAPRTQPKNLYFDEKPVHYDQHSSHHNHHDRSDRGSEVERKQSYNAESHNGGLPHSEVMSQDDSMKIESEIVPMRAPVQIFVPSNPPQKKQKRGDSPAGPSHPQFVAKPPTKNPMSNSQIVSSTSKQNPTRSNKSPPSSVNGPFRRNSVNSRSNSQARNSVSQQDVRPKRSGTPSGPVNSSGVGGQGSSSQSRIQRPPQQPAGYPQPTKSHYPNQQQEQPSPQRRTPNKASIQQPPMPDVKNAKSKISSLIHQDKEKFKQQNMAFGKKDAPSVLDYLSSQQGEECTFRDGNTLEMSKDDSRQSSHSLRLLQGGVGGNAIGSGDFRSGGGNGADGQFAVPKNRNSGFSEINNALENRGSQASNQSKQKRYLNNAQGAKQSSNQLQQQRSLGKDDQDEQPEVVGIASKLLSSDILKRFNSNSMTNSGVHQQPIPQQHHNNHQMPPQPQSPNHPSWNKSPDAVLVDIDKQTIQGDRRRGDKFVYSEQEPDFAVSPLRSPQLGGQQVYSRQPPSNNTLLSNSQGNQPWENDRKEHFSREDYDMDFHNTSRASSQFSAFCPNEEMRSFFKKEFKSNQEGPVESTINNNSYTSSKLTYGQQSTLIENRRNRLNDE
jgi:hypothetical protein